MAQDEHYLKTELYELVRRDPAIFEFLQAGSLDGIWYWDVTRQDQEWMSPRFKDLFGYRDDEIPNTSAWWMENIFPEDRALALDNFARHLADPSHPYDQIVRYRHHDGSTVWVRLPRPRRPRCGRPADPPAGLPYRRHGAQARGGGPAQPGHRAAHRPGRGRTRQPRQEHLPGERQP